MVFEQGIDFRRFKAGETKINTGVGKEGTKFRELDGQRGAIPPAFLCKFIVAVYGLRTRARCVHSPDPAIAPVLGPQIAVTNRRVIYKKGLIRRQTNEMNMDKVESVKVDQSILGRMLDYGSVTILGTGEGFETLCTIGAIASPIELRNSIITGTTHYSSPS